jgi:hypothetical protein
MPRDPHALDSKSVVTLLLSWLAVAIAVGRSGRLQALSPPAPQLVILGLTSAVLLVTAAWLPLRRWALGVDPRALVALHVTRVIAGADFLVRFRDGELPYAFAVPAGWGDIMVGVLALSLLATASAATAGGRRLYAAWNVLGLVDIAYVVATATRLGIADPGSLRALLRLPLSLLPTFLVPLIIATHALLVVRLAPAADPRSRPR